MKNTFKRTLMLLMALIILLTPLNGVIAENANEVFMLYDDAVSEENTVNKAEDISFTREELEGNAKISIMSDIHVLPTELIADNPAYTKAMNSDRKLFTQSQGIFDEAINLVEKNDSEIIMIAGDLTKDGERQSHEYVSSKLEAWKSAREANGKKAAYFVIPGNHDINNYDGYDFTKYDEESGKAELAGLTTHAMFNDMYKSLYEGAELYINSEEYKDYMAKYPNISEGHGASSYAKHVDLEGSIEGKSGLTVIGIDTSINTEDVTADGRASHITAGTMGESLYKWAKKQIIAAKKRNDLVFILSHHGYIPHFVKEPELLKEYLLNEWNDECYDGKKAADAFADLGVSYVFTGHMHAQDIAKNTSPIKNTIYDIETGSTVTYPCPIRHITLKNAIATGNPENDLAIETELIKKIIYTNTDGNLETIDDLTSFAKGTVINEELLIGASDAVFTSELYKGLSSDLSKSITALLESEEDLDNRHEKLSEYLWAHLDDKIIPLLASKVMQMDERNTFTASVEDDKLKIDAKVYFVVMKKEREINAKITITKENLSKLVEELLTKVNNKLKDEDLIKGYIQKLAGPLLEAKVTDTVTVEDLANYAYLSHLAGDEELRAEMQEALKKINEEGAIADILKQINGPLSEVIDNFIDGLNYDPKISEVLDTSEMGSQASMITMALNMKVGDSVKDTLTKLKFMNFEFGADGLKYVLDLDKIFAIDAVKGALAYADGGILDIVDAFTSEDQAAYREYSYKEDNNTNLKWIGEESEVAKFTAFIKDNKLTVMSSDATDYTGYILQGEEIIDLDEKHSAEFTYDKPFTIVIERRLANGYTETYTSNNVLIKENTVTPNPEPNPNPDDDDDDVVVLPIDEDTREEAKKARRPRPNKNIAENEEKLKTVEERKVVNEVINTKPIVVNDKIFPVNFTDIANERRIEAIKNLAARGVLQGMGNNMFKPNETVTRAMIVEVFMRISRDKSINPNVNAKDIKMDDWYYNSVKWALTHGIVTGYEDGTFRPMQKITRQELAVMLDRLVKVYNINMPSIVAVDSSQYSYLPAWSHDAVMSVVSKGLLEVEKEGQNAYNKEVSRADFAYAIDRIVEFVLNN